MSLVVSDDNPRLQSVLAWLAKEAAKGAAVVAAVASVSAKSYARAQRHCDEAHRLLGAAAGATAATKAPEPGGLVLEPPPGFGGAGVRLGEAEFAAPRRGTA